MASKTTNNSLPIATPDFDAIKRSLKDYLKAQDELKDYDFSGSTLSVLLDLLSYNSHMNAFLLNMVGNEAFLDTSVRRSSVVANAKDLGYIPTTAKCATVPLYLEYAPEALPQSSITLPAGSAFAANANGESFIFNVLDDVLAAYVPAKGKYVIENVLAYEGKYFTHEYTVASSYSLGAVDTVFDVTNTGIVLPNLNVDSSLMRVYVNDPAFSTEFVLYEKYTGTLGLDGKSNVFFEFENDTMQVNIRFGDNILGRQPGIGSKIRVEYIVSSGEAANGVALFNQSTPVLGANLTSIVAISPASGGAAQETIESIKFNAPLAFEAQDRGVVDSDYVYLTKQVYPSAKSVIGWGGQDNVPPIYGKVFVSVQPNEGVALTQSDKDRIIAYLTKKGVMTIIPVIVDPDYIFVDTNTIVRYDQNQASVIGGELETLTKETIENYSDTVLNTFKANLEYSNFLTAIDAADRGILSNTTSIALAKRFYIVSEMSQQAEIKFSNEIAKGTVSSSRFVYNSFTNCRFASIGESGLAIVSEQAGNTLIIVSDIGSVNYSEGTVTIKPVTISSSDPFYFDTLLQKYYIRINAQPLNNNVQTKQNQILTIENISVSSQKV